MPGSIHREIIKKFLKDNVEEIKKLKGQGKGWHRKFALKLHRSRPDLFKNLEAARSAIRYAVHSRGSNKSHDKFVVTTDKKISEFNWRDPIEPLKQLKKIFDRGKGSQDRSNWSIKTKNPICVVVIGDLHAGSWATNYDQLIAITEEIINTPNLYVILVGDLLQMSIKLRSILENSDNALPPKWQFYWLDSWLRDIKHKVIASTWDNHAVMREEKVTGFSMYAHIFQQHVIYHDNIGHIDIHVNDQVYKIAAAHFFRGRTMYNPCHGQMRYMRMTSNDREICIAGDSHEPGIVVYGEGGAKKRIAINCGSIQNSGFGKRFFSLTNSPVFPCFVLSPDAHEVTPFWSVKEWIAQG